MPRVREMMSTNVFSVEADRAVIDVVKLMVGKNIGSVVVLGANNPVGIITQRDVLERVILEGLDPRETRAEQIMSSPLFTTSPDEDADRLLLLLSKWKVKRLPVVAGDKLVGIISTTDIIASRSQAVSQQLLELYRKHAW